MTLELLVSLRLLFPPVHRNSHLLKVHLPSQHLRSTSALGHWHKSSVFNYTSIRSHQHLLEHHPVQYVRLSPASQKRRRLTHLRFQSWHTKIPRFLNLVTTLGDYCLETLDSRPDITRVHIVVWSLKPPPYLDPHTQTFPNNRSICRRQDSTPE